MSASEIETSHLSDLQSDRAREQRMADEIVDAILDGEAVFLGNKDKFLGIYTETDADVVRGTAIILHGRGFHPDWQDTVNPLRVGLIEYGWNTLTVQMPVLQKQAKYYDYVPLFPQAVKRIDASISYARQHLRTDQDKQKIILIAHSCGAHMAMAWVEADTDESIDAYVGLGMGATDYKQPMRHAFPLQDLTVPVLDVYAENDYPAVISMAPERMRMMIAAGNKKSDQQVVKQADHYYIDKGDELVRIIGNWLQAL